MQIIKKGYLPEEQEYEDKCPLCGCVFTYTVNDIPWQKTGFFRISFNEKWEDPKRVEEEVRGPLICPYCHKRISNLTNFI